MKEKELNTEDQRLLEISFRALNGDYPNSNSFTSETDLHKFSIYYNAVKTVCKVPSNKRKEDEMKELLHELKISNSIIPEILKFASGSRAVGVDSYLLQTKSRSAHVVNFEWRINVVISSSFVTRVMVPYLEITLTLSDGNKFRFESNVQKFHTLRYSVAKLLKEMQHLELRPSLQ